MAGPEIRRPLEKLGLWRDFLDAGHLESRGICSCWGSDEPRYRDALFHPEGAGWFIDRERFHAMLRSGLALLDEPCDHAVLIDASGRDSDFRGPGSPERLICDHTLAIGRILPGEGAPPWLRIEACETGWRSVAPLADGRQVSMLFTDSGLARPSEGEFTVSANMSCRREVAGDRWLCAGDAAATVDPLSGRGIYTALRSGIEAGEAALQMLAGDKGAAVGYQSLVHQRFARNCEIRTAYYRSEQRWPNALFWRRRVTPKSQFVNL